MPLFIVMVRDSMSKRYMDSYWLSKDSSETRVKQLERTFRAAGFTEHRAWLLEATIEDAKLAETV